MKNAIYRSFNGNGRTHIMPNELEGWILSEVADILLLTCNEIIKADHLMSLAEEPVAKM
jgi:hypothetical protein